MGRAEPMGRKEMDQAAVVELMSLADQMRRDNALLKKRLGDEVRKLARYRRRIALIRAARKAAKHG